MSHPWGGTDGGAQRNLQVPAVKSHTYIKNREII